MGYGFDLGGGIMFTVIPILVTLGFVFVFGSIIISMIQNAKQWKKDNDSPILTVNATVVDKREDVIRHSHANNVGSTMNNTSTSYSTDYYVTFEVESGSRMEFKVPSNGYGFLIRGDYGQLTFQGSRYQGFKRM